jgi:hypothetical protein
LIHEDPEVSEVVAVVGASFKHEEVNDNDITNPNY